MSATARELVDTGHSWLGSIPRTWKLAPLGTVFRERKVTVSDSDFEPLSVSMGGIVPRMDNVALTANNDARKLVRAGDYVINSRSDRKGSGGIAPTDGSVSVISTVLHPVGIYPRFAHHLLRSTAFQEEFYRWGSGIVADLWSTRYQAMRRITLPLPPLSEQRLIAEFLDRETGKIDALIEKQTELITRLHERRERLIESLLAPYPTRRLKRLVTPGRPLTYGILQAGPSVAGGVPYIGPSDIPGEGEAPRRASLRTTTTEIAEAYRRSTLAPGDLVVSIGPAYGRVMITTDELDGVNLTQDTVRVACIPGLIHPKLLVWALTSRQAWGFWDLSIQGATFRRLNLGTLGETPIPMIPVSEQGSVAGYLDRETARIDELIGKTERMIELSKERRYALITAAVTGQIDVNEHGGVA